ncbi:MAG: phosphotransferase family protein [Candidatus Dormibacteria bacterium]
MTSPSSTDPAVLDSSEAVVAYLVERGLLNADRAAAKPLHGGISGHVWRVGDGQREVVVKQAMGRLRGARPWFADQARTVTEGRALQLAASIDASRVPAVVLLDDVSNVVVLEAAPPPVHLWKAQLLEGCVDTGVAGTLGHFVGRLHAATSLLRGGSQLDAFRQDQAFAQLRLRPYFESVQSRDPDIGAVIMPPVCAMAARRACLVHGDLSPKNVVLTANGPWLLDWEVAHLGDPAFDVAFLCTHLLLKSIHVPRAGVLLRAAVRHFVDSYVDAGGLAMDDAHLCALTGALLVARVDGDSPVEYLEATEQRTARALGLSLAGAPPPSLRDAVAGGVRWDG